MNHFAHYEVDTYLISMYKGDTEKQAGSKGRSEFKDAVNTLPTPQQFSVGVQLFKSPLTADVNTRH